MKLRPGALTQERSHSSLPLGLPSQAASWQPSPQYHLLLPLQAPDRLSTPEAPVSPLVPSRGSRAARACLPPGSGSRYRVRASGSAQEAAGRADTHSRQAYSVSARPGCPGLLDRSLRNVALLKLRGPGLPSGGLCDVGCGPSQGGGGFRDPSEGLSVGWPLRTSVDRHSGQGVAGQTSRESAPQSRTRPLSEHQEED